MDRSAEITGLLERYGAGDQQAFALLVEMVYAELRLLARRQLRKNEKGRSFSTTEVVHEAYLKLTVQERAAFKDRGHFFAVAATAMRQILIDHARHVQRGKRGSGAEKTSFDEAEHGVRNEAEKLLLLNDALGRLQQHDAQAAKVLECRYFGGLTDNETAQALGLSLRTVQRGWSKARAFLAGELGVDQGKVVLQAEVLPDSKPSAKSVGSSMPARRV